LKILIYGINYAPELTGIGKYTGELAPWLAEEGHEVKVVTSYPYYPNWKVQSPYSSWFWKKENINKVNVLRCPLYVPNKVSAFKRIIHEFSFVLSSTLALFTMLFQKIDVFVCVVTPFHLGIPAKVFSWLKGIPMIYHIQDLQVDAARDLGMIKNERVLGLMESMEQWILKNTNIVSSISEGMIDKIKNKGVPTTEIVYFPNWVDSKVIYPMPKDNLLRTKLGFSNTDKIVLYSGNLGEKQGLEIIIDAARYFKSDSKIKFLIVGEGGTKAKLEHLAKAHELSNVYFSPLQPYDQLSALLSSADLHLVLQKEAATDLVMPSKLTSILAVGGCSIVTAIPGSTLFDTVSDHELGICIPPQNIGALIDAIENSLNADLNYYKQNARKYALKNLDKENILKAFENNLHAIVKGQALPRLGQSIEMKKWI